MIATQRCAPSGQFRSKIGPRARQWTVRSSGAERVDGDQIWHPDYVFSRPDVRERRVRLQAPSSDISLQTTWPRKSKSVAADSGLCPSPTIGVGRRRCSKCWTTTGKPGAWRSRPPATREVLPTIERLDNSSTVCGINPSEPAGKTLSQFYAVRETALSKSGKLNGLAT